MSIQSQESIIKDEREKRKLIIQLDNISDIAKFATCYQSQYTVADLKKKMKDIQTITKRALEES